MTPSRGSDDGDDGGHGPAFSSHSRTGSQQPNAWTRPSCRTGFDEWRELPKWWESRAEHHRCRIFSVRATGRTDNRITGNFQGTGVVPRIVEELAIAAYRRLTETGSGDRPDVAVPRSPSLLDSRQVVLLCGVRAARRETIRRAWTISPKRGRRAA